MPPLAPPRRPLAPAPPRWLAASARPFTAPNGSSDPAADNSNWRITTWPAQGTQNKQNGIRFDVPTVGYRNVTLSWDLRNSNTASKYTRLQYTTNGTDFIDFQLITMPPETWVNGQSASFVGVPGVENNPKFGVRFVTEFESTALQPNPGSPAYIPCNSTSTYGTGGHPPLRHGLSSPATPPSPVSPC